ncbi:molybdate ABC transporter substrate-binding protein [Motiliproteus sp. SC1-56]|uniref:molybdate ABC transporter substrate-binding protein n=1 Tax=Motiliproteus sp. SC1-56 TaxID=2799565 RepID=UPI001F5C1A36|nr:molybdate ABC transporter substrate-binding protein [Motiliproteus sp. SC1-56]
MRALLRMIIAGCLMTALAGQAAETRVAVASNFTTTAKALAADFERRTGHRVRISFGSTGKLYTQIYNGAPFDVFLAADAARPARAEREGLAVPGTRFTYARGKLALWSTDDAPEQRLRQGAYQRLAIANPKTAPYGAAATRLLEQLGLAALRDRLVMGENIAQTYQFVATGNADLGLIAVSQLDRARPGHHWLVPESLYPPIPQQAVLLKQGERSRAARAFLDYLDQPPAQAIIAGYGYGVGR